MSIDIDLVIDTGNNYTTVEVVGNMTHNVQPMWRKALQITSGVDMNLCDFNEWGAEKALPLLEKALEHMKQNRDEYVPLNPSNGWGSYESAVEYLSDFVTACQDHPACMIITDC